MTNISYPVFHRYSFKRVFLLLPFLLSAFSAFPQASVQTDLPDYPPGSTVLITGSGWMAGEVVTLQVLHADGTYDNATSPSGAHLPWTVTADALGNISSSWIVPLDEDELGATLLLTAIGNSSGLQASWTFTDANTKFKATGLPANTTVGVTYVYNGVTSNISFSTGASGNGTSSTYAISGALTFTFNSPITVGGVVYVLDTTDPVSPTTVSPTGALTITGNYIEQGGSGGLTITAPPCAQGGTFSITYTPASGPAVTENRSTPFSFNAKKNTGYSITSITSPVNGNSYTGPATVTGTTPNANDFTQTVTLSFADTQPPTVTGWLSFITSTDDNSCTKLVSVPDVGFNDNCAGIISVSWSMTGATIASGTGQIGSYLLVKGTTTVHYTVTDAAGNATSVSSNITVADSTPPLLTLWPPIYATTDLGVCSASVMVPDVLVSDNCPEALSISWVMSGVGSGSGTGQIGVFNFPLGTTKVSYTVTDPAGNNTSGSATVIVEDKEFPIIVAPDLVVVEADKFQCSATGIYLGEPQVTENCEIAYLGNNAPSSFPVGETLVEWTVIDKSNNTSSAFQYVRVLDTQPPVLTAPEPVNVGTDPYMCFATVSVGEAVVSDNCGSVTLTWVMSGANTASGTGQVGTRVFNPGQTLITFTAKDGSMNTTVVVSEVNVTDNEFPVISVPADIFLSACEPVPAWNVTASDNCGVTLSDPEFQPNNSFAQGTTTFVIFNATDPSGNKSTASFSVTRAPSLSANSILTSPILCFGGKGKVTVSGSGGTPPYSGTGVFEVTAGSWNYTVTDSKGCSANTSIVVTEPTAVTSTFSTNNSYLYFGYSGDQSATISAKPSGGTGPYKVTITMNRPLLCNQITSTGDETWSAPGGTNTNNSCPVSGSLALNPSVQWINVVSGATVGLNVTLMADARFTLTVEDSKGCIYSSSTLTGGGPNGGIDAEDVRCFTNSGLSKVQICHRTGNIKNPCVTICVDESAVADHIAHGDYYGKCNNTCTAPVANARIVADGSVAASEMDVSVFPNPFNSTLTVIVQNPGNESVKIQVFDLTGKSLDIRQSQGGHDNEFNLETDALPVGIHILRVNIGKEIRAIKIMKQ